MVVLVKKIVFLFVLVSLTGCTSFLFQPQRPTYATPDMLEVLYEDIFTEASDNLRLHGWKLLAENNTEGSVLYFHGNAENISTHFTNIFWLTKQGFDVYLFDYRGYGRSEGTAQLDAIISDIDIMIGYVVKQIPENEKLAVVGHSLGGALAIYGVAKTSYKDRIKLLLTVESFADYRDVTQDVLSLSWLTWLFQWPLSFTVDNSYRPADVVAEVAPVPLVIMHSKQDRIIPFYHAEALYAAAGQPKKLQLITGSHNLVFNEAENRRLILEYLIGRRLSLVPGRSSKN